MSRIRDKYKELKEAKAAQKNGAYASLFLCPIEKKLSSWVIRETLVGVLYSYNKVKRRKAYFILVGNTGYIVYANNNLKDIMSSIKFNEAIEIKCTSELNENTFSPVQFEVKVISK